MKTLVQNAINLANENILTQILDNVPVGAYAVDTNRRIFYWNKKAEEITGFKYYELVGKACYNSNCDGMDDNGVIMCKVNCPLLNSIYSGKSNQVHVLIDHKNGNKIPIVSTSYPIFDNNNEIIGAYILFTLDNTPYYKKEIKSPEKNIEYYDELTELPNKKYILQFINYKFMEFEKFNRPFALLFGNLDNFKDFNNKYGTEYGDRILQNIARNIKDNYRKADLIGRWQDDIFAGVFNMVVSEKIGNTIGEKMYQWINDSDIMLPTGERAGVTITIGVAVVRPNDNVNSIISRVCNLISDGKKNKKKIVTDF